MKAKANECILEVKALVDEGKKAGPKRKTFIFMNNRLEGNALATIAAAT